MKPRSTFFSVLDFLSRPAMTCASFSPISLLDRSISCSTPSCSTSSSSITASHALFHSMFSLSSVSQFSSAWISIFEPFGPSLFHETSRSSSPSVWSSISAMSTAPLAVRPLCEMFSTLRAAHSPMLGMRYSAPLSFILQSERMSSCT